MLIDWSISAGAILQTLVVLAGLVAFAYALLFDVRQLKREVGGLGTKVEVLSRVMVDLAKVDGKFNTLEGRVDRCESDIRELRHGEGFTLPFRYRPPGSE